MRTTTGLNDTERAAIESMNLPTGYTCAECGHFNYCKLLFDCDSTNTHCDWAPSRFVLKLPTSSNKETYAEML